MEPVQRTDFIGSRFSLDYKTAYETITERYCCYKTLLTIMSRRITQINYY